MKRKLFTIICAFMALVGFQVNAQSYYWIEADTTTNMGSAFMSDANGTQTSASYTNVPSSPGTSFFWNNQDWTGGANTYMFFNGDFSLKVPTNSFTLGDYARYFKVSSASTGNTEIYIDDKSGTSRFTLNGAGITGQTRWQLAKIDASGGATNGVTTAQVFTPGQTMEGYLVYPEAGVRTYENNFKMVFIERATGKLVLDTYGNWNANTNNFKAKYNPIWMKISPISGRWARKADFDGNALVKFKYGDNKYLTVGSDSEFRVGYAGAIAAASASNMNSLTVGSSTVGTNAALGIDYFNLASPKSACKVVTVSDKNVILNPPAAATTGAYGDKLELLNKITSGSFLTENMGRQEFAIWIDDAGTMTIYPKVAIAVDYQDQLASNAGPKALTQVRRADGTPVVSPDIDLDQTDERALNTGVYDYGRYIYNAAIYRNTPIVETSSQYANMAFRFGGYGSQTVVAPTKSNTSEYTNMYYSVELVGIDALTQSGRFFMIEVQNVGTWSANRTINNTSSYVLTAYSQTGSLYLTPREQIRPNNNINSADVDYSLNAFDSIQMGAHWEVVKNSDGTITMRNELNPSITIGYVPANGATTMSAPGVGVVSNWTANVVNSDAGTFNLTMKQGAVVYTLDSVAGGWTQANGRIASRTGSAYTTYWENALKITDVSTAGFCNGLQFKLISDPESHNWPDTDDNGKVDHSNGEYYPSDDSLCIYMYRKLDACDIIEAFGKTNFGRFDYNGTKLPGIVSDAVVITKNADGGFQTGKITIEPMDSLRLMTGDVRKGTHGYLAGDVMTDIYKWHFIKYGDKYLVYDTINPNASTPEAMYGFRFKTTNKRLATPVRFYQPLVGDLKFSNFIIEFVVPTGNYQETLKSDGSVQVWSAYQNKQWWTTGVSDASYAAGKTRFAKLGSQTSALSTVNTATTATRFTPQGTPVDPTCKMMFVRTDSLLEADLYLNPTTAKQQNNPDPGTYYLSQDAKNLSTASTSKIRLVLADTLYANTSTDPANPNGRIGLASGDRYYPNGYGYKSNINVELYYVLNEKNEYLTVTQYTDMNQTDAQTVSDVSGAKLAFLPKAGKVNDYTDPRQFQMFAAIKTCTNHYSFLPVSSYVMDYKTKTWVADKRIDKNLNLGTITDGAADIRNSFRVGQYGAQLVVMPGKGELGSIPACEYTLTPTPRYVGPFCLHSWVGPNRTSYYTYNSTVTCADHSKPQMHWHITPAKYPNGAVIANDIFDFTTELTPGTKTNLNGQYYMYKVAQDSFVMLNKNGIKIGYIGDNVVIRGLDGCENAPDFTNDAVPCVDNYRKFSDEEVYGFYWSFIEGTYEDRYISNDVNAVYNNNTSSVNALDYQTKDYQKDANVTQFRLEPIYTKIISNHHNIPYYNIIKEVSGRAYYLDVTNGQARFVYCNDATMKDIVNNPTKYPEKNFCFPYRVVPKKCEVFEWNNIGDADKTASGAEKLTFIQSMDNAAIGGGNNAYLVRIEGASNTMSALPINTATVNYGAVLDNPKTVTTDTMSATTWFPYGHAMVDYEWVKLAGVADETKYNDASNNTSAWLTSTVPANFYMEASGANPNYAVLNTNGTGAKLTFKFVEKQMIGQYSKKPIWYYFIVNEKGQYLTNAQFDGGYTWTDGKPYAYFKDVTSAIDPKSDPDYKKYLFGLRYVPATSGSYKAGAELFYVVSAAKWNYNWSAGAPTYYYLSGINNRMVFTGVVPTDATKVEQQAMPFQVGQVSDKGAYTDIEDLGNGVAVIGVEGGVKVLNGAGAVEIFSVDGRLLKSAVISGNEQTISAPKGIVIVRNNGKAVKVSVK